MERRSTPKGPTSVDAIKHADKRFNIPTADGEVYVDPAIEEIRQVRYARDESLDPQLVWRGKYPTTPEDAVGAHNDLVTDAPPIYIQEKIDPRVLVENLRQTSAKHEDEPELTLFDSFDGLDEWESVEYYQHDANWSNRMILGDSLQVMSSLAEREKLRGKVQMVYIDPPYGIKFGSNWQVSARNREIRDGNLADAAREAEQIKAFRDTWELGIHSYLGYLRDRLIAARDLLTESGSCFVQIGEENVHLVRSLLDEIFGPENFVSQIVFATTSGFTQATGLGRMGDLILWYARDIGKAKIRPLLRESRVETGYNWVMLPDGSRRPATKEERQDSSLLPPGARLYRNDNLRSQGASSKEQNYEYDGQIWHPGARLHWKTSCPDGLDRLTWARRIHAEGSNLEYVRYLDDSGWAAYTNVWTDTVIGGFTDEKIYVVQTTTKVIGRCMLLCTDPGDLVLDPTAGSGTTASVAEQWGRRWITVDTSRVAIALARQRLMGSRFPWYLLADSREGAAKERELSAGAKVGTTYNHEIRQGFVYDRARRITLGGIANNPDIREGMTPTEIDAAINRHAEFQPLFDRPFEDSKKVRVAGPFTVESLTPYRALSFGDAPESVSEAEAAKDADGPTFEQSILDNLKKAGIQNGRKAEKFVFSSFESYAGTHIQAVGDRIGDDDGSPRRIAIAIGPQYGTVSTSFVKKAAKEAIEAEDIDLVAVLGFAFDPQVTGMTEDDGVTVATDQGFASVEGERKLGRIPVLMVRMNADLLMGEELKKSGAGNLFTVFGEPDIKLQETSDGLVVELRGVDVYDPTTGEVRSNDTDQIALWMIDTNYNEESFFVRHCYFTGGTDPYKRLKTALKSDINEDAWASLYQTTSRPFPKPETGQIAIKVINDYGDEVMRIFDVHEGAL